MHFKKYHKTQQSASAVVAVLEQGIRILTPHQALTLKSAYSGVVHIVHGRVWATFDGPHCGPANDLGDRVLLEGDELQVRADQRLVIEPWARSARDLVYFDFKWEPPQSPKPIA